MSAAMFPSCDRCVAQAAPAGLGSSATEHPRMVLATTVQASSLPFIDGSVVNVGLPSIHDRLIASDRKLSAIDLGANTTPRDGPIPRFY